MFNESIIQVWKAILIGMEIGGIEGAAPLSMPVPLSPTGKKVSIFIDQKLSTLV
jgi:hypothetical protein